VHLFFRSIPQWFERRLIGAYPENVRANIRIELLASFWYGLFFAASLTFFPVILRRLGATPFELALYVVFSYIGQTLSPLSLMLLRRMAPIRFSVIAWSFGRGVLVFGALSSNTPWLLALAALFWIAEALPSPAYARIMQQIYPPRHRGRAMSTVRIGVAIVVLIATPIAGWALDQAGHPPLFALAAIFGVVSSLIFSRVRPIDGAAEPESPPALRALLPIVRHDRRFALYLLVPTIYGFGAVMALPLYPVVQVTKLQLSYTTIGYLNLVQSLCWLAGFLRVGASARPVRTVVGVAPQYSHGSLCAADLYLGRSCLDVVARLHLPGSDAGRLRIRDHHRRYRPGKTGACDGVYCASNGHDRSAWHAGAAHGGGAPRRGSIRNAGVGSCGWVGGRFVGSARRSAVATESVIANLMDQDAFLPGRPINVPGVLERCASSPLPGCAGVSPACSAVTLDGNKGMASLAVQRGQDALALRHTAWKVNKQRWSVCSARIECATVPDE